jgi:hypothetical protein
LGKDLTHETIGLEKIFPFGQGEFWLPAGTEMDMKLAQFCRLLEKPEIPRTNVIERAADNNNFASV